MKIQKYHAAAILLAIFATTLSTAQAEAPTPGTTTDPLITQSYFEQNTLSEAKVKEIVASAIAAAGGSQPSGSNGGTGTTPTAAMSMRVVQLQNGQTLYAGVGAEFIVRTGRVLAVSNDENGIPDVTGGKDLAAGTEVALNHLLIFPVEGRGIKPSPKNDTTIYVMVRGGYLLLNADGSKVSQ